MGDKAFFSGHGLNRVLQMSTSKMSFIMVQNAAVPREALFKSLQASFVLIAADTLFPSLFNNGRSCRKGQPFGKKFETRRTFITDRNTKHFEISGGFFFIFHSSVLF